MALVPVALVLLLHLMLVLLWPTSAPVRRDHAAERRFFALTWLPPLRPRAAPLPPPARAAGAAARDAKPLAASASTAPASSTPPPAPSTATEPLPNQEDMSQRSPEFPTSVPTAAGTPSLMDTAKRLAGPIDRELRGGKLAPLAPDPDLPILRLRRALESAHIDHSRTLVTDSYTQPDGVIVYRFRLGSKVWCRQSGGAAPGMLERSEGAKLAGAGSAGGAGVAGIVQCPGGESGWSRR